MSINEKLTQRIATDLSRRGFLKSIGGLAVGLGLALLGNVEVAQADQGCCPNPACSNCTFWAACPVGYQCTITTCCLGHCTWGCNKRKCINDDYCNPGTVCYCAHNHESNCGGGYCGDVPSP